MTNIFRQVLTIYGEAYTEWLGEDGYLYYMLEESEDLEVVGIKKGDIEINPSLIVGPMSSSKQDWRYTKALNIVAHGTPTRELILKEFINHFSDGKYRGILWGQVLRANFLKVKHFPQYKYSFGVLFVYLEPETIRLKINKDLFN